MLNKLTAISPVDGRYRNTTETLADYFSEQALIRYRIRVEVEYFIALCEIPLPQLAGIDRTKFAALRARQADRVGHQPRRQSHRVHHQGKNGHARTGSLQGIRSLRAYLAGHQQHGHSALAEGGDGGFLLPRRRRGARQTGGFRRRVARGADAGAHARPARFAHDAGQGVHGFRRTHREAAGHAARHRRSGQVRRRDRQLQRTPCGLSAVRLGGSSARRWGSAARSTPRRSNITTTWPRSSTT